MRRGSGRGPKIGSSRGSPPPRPQPVRTGRFTRIGGRIGSAKRTGGGSREGRYRPGALVSAGVGGPGLHCRGGSAGRRSGSPAASGGRPAAVASPAVRRVSWRADRRGPQESGVFAGLSGAGPDADRRGNRRPARRDRRPVGERSGGEAARLGAGPAGEDLGADQGGGRK